MSATEQTPAIYQPRDAVSSAANATIVTGTAGLFASTIQNTLQKQNVGPLGIFTKTGGTIAMFAGIGGAYKFVSDASANLREKDDHWNTVWGGFAGGAVMGLKARTFPAVLGYGIIVATVLGTFDYTGGRLEGTVRDQNEDKYERRESIRKNYRSPGWETLAELGEGRGIQGPGYAERRRERIKEKYGIDVPVEQPPAS